MWDTGLVMVKFMQQKKKKTSTSAGNKPEHVASTASTSAGKVYITIFEKIGQSLGPLSLQT